MWKSFPSPCKNVRNSLAGAANSSCALPCFLFSRLPALKTVGQEVSLGSNKYNNKAPDGCTLWHRKVALCSVLVAETWKWRKWRVPVIHFLKRSSWWIPISRVLTFLPYSSTRVKPMMPLSFFFLAPLLKKSRSVAWWQFLSVVQILQQFLVWIFLIIHFYFLGTVAAYLTFAYIGGKQEFSVIVHLFFSLLDKLWRNSQSYLFILRVRQFCPWYGFIFVYVIMFKLFPDAGNKGDQVQAH